MAKQKNKDIRQCLNCGDNYCFNCDTAANDKACYCSIKCEREFTKEQESIRVDPEFPSDEEMNDTPF